MIKPWVANTIALVSLGVIAVGVIAGILDRSFMLDPAIFTGLVGLITAVLVLRTPPDRGKKS